jgi:chemotaxis protein methyltransferase CheR
MNTSLSTTEFNLFRKYIAEQCGIEIEEDKAYLIESRFSKLLADSGLSSFEELYNRITGQADRRMAEKIIDAITTNETLWFRDKTPWDILENVLLPKYIDEFRSGKRLRVRIWSAACSTGQEPYSIAMMIDNFLAKNLIKDVTLSQFEILATDISTTVLEIAQNGKYSSVSIIRGLDQFYKDKYFHNQVQTWELAEKIKNVVRFQQLNLQDSFQSLGEFDIVFCRYVMIYFSNQLKQEIANKMAGLIKPGGAFFIGSSELFSDTQNSFETVSYQNGIYYQRR